MARILILSGPDDLLDCMDFTILCISAQETGKKLRVTNEHGGGGGEDSLRADMSL